MPVNTEHNLAEAGMGLGKGKTEKGVGGKRGQSGKDNWVTHQEEKQDGRQRRRIETRKMEQAAKADSEPDD